MNKMIDLNLIITTIALIVNGLKNPLKYKHIQVALKKKAESHKLPTRNTL